jgi:hypothetical protein
LRKPKNPIYLIILAIILSYIFIFAPKSSSSTFNLINKMYSRSYRDVNPLIFSIFNLMGIWPLLYIMILVFEANNQKMPVWPFLILSFFAGGFIFLIYFSYREPSPVFSGKLSRSMKLADKKINAILIGLIGIVLLLYGIVYGDFSNYLTQFWSNSLVHIMSLDFLLVIFLFPVILKDDMKRRGIYSPSKYFLYSILPLIGPIIYIFLRSEQLNE